MNNIFYFFSGLTLEEIIQSLEDIDTHSDSEIDITLFPPNNACSELTDEDSGGEDVFTIDNFPGSQLLSTAEISTKKKRSDDDENKEERTISVNAKKNSKDGENGSEDSDPEFNIPLSLLQKRRKKIHKKKYTWKNQDRKIDIFNWPIKENVVQQRTPSALFDVFLDKQVVSMLTNYTNLYASQHNRQANVTCQEIEIFIGVLILSGYNCLPRRRMFWENSPDTNNLLVSNAISRNRFEYIMSNFHCCNNETLDQTDKFAKVRPFFDIMNSKFLENAPHSEFHSIDEAMVPYFGRHSCKQFIKGKPIRYGFKFWVGTTDRGYALWFEPYQGAGSKIDEQYKDLGLGPSIILQYAKVLLSQGNFPYHLFFDNFFTTIPLLDELAKIGLRGTGTIRENRIGSTGLNAKKLLKKKNRGYYEYCCTSDNKIVVVNWNDNNIVSIASNAENVFPIKQITRFSQKEKKRFLLINQHYFRHTMHIWVG